MTDLPNNKHRIQQIKKMRWIEYSRATEILAVLNDLLYHQGTTRIPNPFIIGESNSGKTELLKRFVQQNPPEIIEGRDYLHIPVLFTISPPKPNEQRLYNEILATLRVPHRERTDIDFKMRQTLDALEKVRCKVIIIDEIQQLLASNPSRQREFLNTIKYIMNKTGISVVCAGTEDAHRVVSIDPQLANRFGRVELKPWTLTEEYAGLVQTIRKSMNLLNDTKPLDLEFAKFVLYQSEGLIGEMTEFIRLASIEAIKNGTEQLDIETLKKVNWIKPSDR